MKSGRELLRLPVIALPGGKKVGTVTDLVIDLDSRTLAGLAIGGPDGEERLVPFNSIRRIGPQAIMVEEGFDRADDRVRERLQELAGNRIDVVGLKVLTEEGRLVGTVSDVTMDERTGALENYEVSGGALRDALVGRSHLSVASPTSVGDEYVVVPEGVLPARVRFELMPAGIGLPRRGLSRSTTSGLERVAAELVAQQEDLVLGRETTRTIANDDAGGVIAFEGEQITREVIQKAKDAGKLNELVQAAGEGAAMAMARDVTERYARLAVGRMAGRTVHSTAGEVIVAQGDVVEPEDVSRAYEAGVMDQLMEAVERAGSRTSAQTAARGLWDQVSDRMGWLIGRR